MIYKFKIIIILYILAALSGNAYAGIDTLSEEALFLKLQAELPADSSGCVITPLQKNHNYIRVYNIKARIIDLHPEWSTKTGFAILNNEVQAGMTKVQVQASWGLPENCSVKITETAIQELWHYGDTNYL